MSKNILDFLSSYEDELNSQAAFYEKNISRIEGQIKDTKKQITAIKKNIDKELAILKDQKSKAERAAQLTALADLMDSNGYTIDELKELMSMPKPTVE